MSELYRKDGPFLHQHLAVSPGDEWLLYGRQPLPVSGLMLVENFR